MRQFMYAMLTLLVATPANTGDLLVLANEVWPPFVIEGEQRGFAEQLVCEALERAGWGCQVKTEAWRTVLEEARIGAIDGLVAAWRTPEDEEYLLFSEPYMANHIIGVVSEDAPLTIDSTASLKGKWVAMITDYAYGPEIDAVTASFQSVPVATSLEAMQAVQDGRAQVALMDELVAREALESSQVPGVIPANTILATRDLYFAVSRQNPLAAMIIADFQRTYASMLADGTVNDILQIDWLATDFGHPGQTDLVLRNGVSMDALHLPSEQGSVYSMGSSIYSYDHASGQDPSRVNYQVGGKPHSSLQSAINSVFGTEVPCEHKEYSSQFDCTKIFKN